MRLNQVEFFAMNNPVRRIIQKHIEFRRLNYYLKKNKIDLLQKSLLDAGCGSGYASQLLYEHFSPSRLIGIDFMEEQISQAKSRGVPAEFVQGDLTQLSYQNEFDAVFIFGVLHHIVGWQKAIAHLSKSLTNGGVLYLEEINISAVNFFDRFFGTIHPKEGRFTWTELEQALIENQFDILESDQIILWGFRSYFCKKKGE